MDCIENEVSNNSAIVVCIHCCVNIFTELLPSNNRGYPYTDQWEQFIKYDVEMNSGDMTNIPTFIKIGSGIPKLTRRIHRHTDSTVTS
jgi:hypothetical protein